MALTFVQRRRSPDSKASPRNASHAWWIEESSPLPELSEQGRTKAGGGRRIKDVTSFLLTLAVVSVALNKAVLVQEFLNFDTVSTFVWLPSLFIVDMIFLSVLYHGLTIQYYKFYSSFPILLSLLVWIPCAIAVLFTAVVVALEVTCVIGHRSRIPWNLAIRTISEWDQFQKMLLSKADECYIKVWMVAIVQATWTLILVSLLPNTRRNGQHVSPGSRLTLPLSSWFDSPSSPAYTVPRLPTSVTSFCASRGRMTLLATYLLMVMTIRPDVPYKKLSQTPCFTVPREIYKGLEQYHHDKQLLSKKLQDDRSRDRFQDTTTIQATMSNVTGIIEPLNVVLIFLESIRADIMPFDGSTPWARRFVPDPSAWTDVTPFYSNWTKLAETLHIPLIKTSAGLTHKSLLSTLCSMHAIPLQGTMEQMFSFYHACLPQILAQFNYSSIFFQPATEEWEHQKELMSAIGFPVFYGKESYDFVHQTSDEFKKAHTANYFGYEDNIMISPVMKWVDQQTSPFFLSYLFGATHDPYVLAPQIKWEPKQFSNDEKVNGYLNAVSYVDHWLLELTGEFEKRNLFESTLFCIVGDHGVTLYDRGSDFTVFDQKYEEALNVGVSFHSRNERWTTILRESQPDITNGNYTSIDVLPTILEILGIDFGNPALLNGKNNNSVVDGQSMLHPSGRRLQLSIPNPGYTMVLRDGSFVLIRRLDDAPEAFDVSVDPEQIRPLYITPEAQTTENTTLARWAKKAVAFMEYISEDLYSSYGEGKRCHNCTLSYLISKESLDEWDPEQASHSYTSFYESTDGWYGDDWDPYSTPEESDYNDERNA